MAIYKAPVSSSSDAHGASLHNNQNNIIWVYTDIQKYIQRCGKSHPESSPPQWEFQTWDCPLEIHSEEKGRSLIIDCIKQLLDKGLEERIPLLLPVKIEIKWL